MTSLHGKHRPLAALLLPLLAAALACSNLTQAGSAPTLTPAATSLPSTAAAAATSAPAGGGAQTPPAGGAVVVDPCTLMTTDEATALVGVPAAAPSPLPGGCIYFDSTITTTGVGFYAFPASKAQGFLGQYAPALQANGVPIDNGVAAKLTKDSAAGDMPASVNDLFALTAGIPGYEITQPAGIGTAALWSWHTLDQNQEGALIAAKPGALVAMILAGTPTTQESDAQPAMEAIVKRILANLPDNFTVANLP